MEKNISSILLTGIPGVGKTTIVKKLIKIFNEKHIKCIGFFTEEMRSENGIRIGFDVVDVNGKRGVLAREHPTDNIRRPHVGKYSVYTKDFEDIALPMLKIEAKTILIVDEIGKMELLSKKFKQRIEEVFGKTLILATIPNRQTIDIVEKIRSDHSSLVLEITKKNRNEIVDEIFQKINQMLTI
ncbi:nucleoside-triphosphatase THEP1 isoform X2 [Episyrphus balteatus]|uniref:nucleoside-triphosphatase THEP1 isoform X2 n=1 Tax=Episyrphus balteatus TaxID=286459 RepID=UPI00248624C6|nr:nucleoside-triphosphatase THEP1 isoform X2 [Episyrphus balteatus]